MEPLTDRYRRTVNTSRDGRSIRKTSSHPRDVELIFSFRATATSPDPLRQRATGRDIATIATKLAYLTAHVGLNTPKSMSDSLEKNQSETADRKNMRQKMYMLECPSDSHYCQLVCNIGSSLGEILYMKGEISQVELFAELEIGHVVKDPSLDRLGILDRLLLIEI